METKIIKIEDGESEETKQKLSSAAQALRSGETVAFPTETVYGLGANALSAEAVAKIFEAKGRPQDNPLIVHVDGREMLQCVVEEIPLLAEKVMESFWPGPLTLILPRGKRIPSEVTAGLDTAPVRMPSNPIARALIRLAGVPVAAPSANRSGSPSPTRAEHVLEDLGGKIPFLIDGGPSDIGLESTVLDLTADCPTILRPGGVTAELLGCVIDEVRVGGGMAEGVPKSPGMKYKHYAPKAEVTVAEGSKSGQLIRGLIQQFQAEGKRVGVLAAGVEYHEADACILCGAEPAQFASSMFAGLRQLDAAGAEVILAEPPGGRAGLGLAIRNRLYKSANGRVVDSDAI